MICFILARDEKEFKRYDLGSLRTDLCIDIRNKDENGLARIILRVLDSVDDKVGLLFVVLEQGVGSKKDDCKNDMSTDSVDALLKFLVEVFVQTSIELKKACIGSSDYKKIINKIENCTKTVSIGGSKIIVDGQELVIKAEEKNEVSEETVVFIHWGGGAPTTYEDRFASSLDELLKSKNALFTNIRAYAFSSRRAEMFDVTAHKIVLPKTCEEIIALENRFKNAQVDEAFVHCAAKCPWPISDANRTAMTARLERIRDCLSVSSLDSKDKKSLLASIGKALKDIAEKTNAMDVDDETAHLMAKILNKEVFNG